MIKLVYLSKKTVFSFDFELIIEKSSLIVIFCWYRFKHSFCPQIFSY